MNVHHIEIIPRPHWRRFLRRDQFGQIVNDRDECREANARHALRHDRRLWHLVERGDVEAARLRLCDLGIYASPQQAAALIEGARQ